jgi:hypothetical protein
MVYFDGPVCYLAKLFPLLWCPQKKLSAYEGDKLGPEDVKRYMSIVGALQYLCHTRPDLAFSINKVCQYLNSHTTVHWTIVKRILRYIKHHLRTGISIRKSSYSILSAFLDADWVWCFDDQQSTGDLPYFRILILFSRVQRNKRSHVLIRRPSINPWPTPQQRSCGFNHYFENYMFHVKKELSYGVIIRVLNTYHQI